MQKRSKAEARRSLLLCLFILGLVTAVIVLPYQFGSAAAQKGLLTRTQSADPGLPNYDIRNFQKEEAVADYLASARSSIGKSAVGVADVRDGFVRGEESLRTRLPQVKVEYNQDIRIPEVITPDVMTSKIEFLSSPSTAKRVDILRNFVKENSDLVGVDSSQADALTVTADYTNPDGNLSFAHLEQRINDVPVFRGEVKAGFTKDGRIIRVINNLAPGLNYSSLSTDFGDPLNAVKSASANIKFELPASQLVRNDAVSSDLKSVFGEGDWATTAEKMYFPTEPGIAVPAWRVLIWEPVSAYYVITDARTGTVLWRKNIANDQTQSATYNVYSTTTNLGLALDSPAPGTPGPVDPTTNFQAALTTRTNVTLIGNEAAQGLAFNNNGWITDGTNGVNGDTSGNALIAGLDIDGTNGVDAPQAGTSRVFSFTYTPGNVTGGVDGGDANNGAAIRSGAVTQLFYFNNRYHDQLYKVGFTEAARNFQLSNFGRGGAENDRVSAEAQDSSGTNNANFATPADGTSGRMQMYLFTGPTPGRDGDFDGNVVWHEHTHGLSNRLIGNGSGLTTTRAGGSGEGWSDLYAFLLGSKTADPINGVYATGGYVTYRCCGLTSFTTNYYHGIRRFPYAVKAFTGGPGNLPHNPLTFADLNTVTATDGAYPCSALIGCSGSASEVHNGGEIWAVAGVEVWAKFVARLGHNPGTLKTMQLYTDGMKLSPLNPTYVQSRDSIIAAAAASPLAPEASADVADVREGFRIRGIGFSATDNGTVVVEAFDTPNAIAVDPFSVSDSTGDNDGYPEPGENVLLSIAVKNPNTGATINNVTVNVNGGTNVNYGNIADGATVTMQVPFTIPPATVCGSDLTVVINVASVLGSQAPQNRTFKIGVPVGGAPVTFTSSVAVRIPGTGTGPGVADVYPTTLNVSGLTGNKKISLEFTNLSTTYPGDMDWLLVGPGGQKFIIMSDVISSFDTQTNATVVLKDSAANSLPATSSTTMAGEWKPTDITSGDTFAAPAPAGPYLSPGPVGVETLASAFGTASATMNGTWSLYGVDDVSGDFATITGWKLTFESNDYVCSLVNVRSRSDFDGDGKTDFSVFRPSDGNWYMNQSTAGFGVVHWGTSGDTITPGDFDADGKTDWAIFRPNADPSQTDFYILNSATFTLSGVSWGLPGDVPVIADYDGDGKSDIAVYRPSSNVFFVLQSGGGIIVKGYGIAGDVPIAGDFIGDNKADITIFRPCTNQWWIFNGVGDTVVPFGSAGDMPVPADYNGDNKDDIAIFRPSTGQWIYQPSGGGAAVFGSWGTLGDVPVPGDYDGDGKDDFAIYRNGQWWALRSTFGPIVTNFGIATDKPIPKGYIP